MLGFDRITFDPNVMGGKACIRGMRLTVSLIVNLVANGASHKEILEAYPYLEKEDIVQARKYAGPLRQRRSAGRAPRRIRRSPRCRGSDSVSCRKDARRSAAGLAWPPSGIY